MSEEPTYEHVIDTVAAAFRTAYLDRPGDEGALLHAKRVAGSAIADVLADHMKHETSVRMVVRPDVDDATVDTVARDAGLPVAQVRAVLASVLSAQVRAGCTQIPPASAPAQPVAPSAEAVRAPITAAEVAAIPHAAADIARRMLEDVIGEHVADATEQGEDWHGVHPISAEGDARAILAAARPLLDTGDHVVSRDLEGCPFCDIARGRAPATMVREWPDAIAFVPLNPVTPGHVLIVPRTHVYEFTHEPWTTALAARRAAELAVDLDPIGNYNLITSAGEDATQTVDHLHWHLVPRREGDGLALPWAPAPLDVTATTCAGCGMRIGHVNYRGRVLGWGCANGEDDGDRLYLAPQLARALVDLLERCVAADDDAPLEAMLEAVAAHPSVVPDAAATLAAIAEVLMPMVPQLLRRTADGTTSP